MEYASLRKYMDIITEAPADEPAKDATVSQGELGRMFERGNRLEFIKATPVALVPYSMVSKYASPEQVAEIGAAIGDVDKTSYTDDQKQQGYLVFQWDSKHNRPDLYVADAASVKSKYAKFKGKLPDDTKARSKIPSLVVLDHLGMDPSKIPFFIKKTPTEMIKASDAGLEGKTIQTDWGTQAVAQGGYLVREDNGHCYTVAPDGAGLPIGYVSANETDAA
jgi:hypothetical protein